MYVVAPYVVTLWVVWMYKTYVGAIVHVSIG